MNDYIDQLIREAKELERSFLAGVSYGRCRYFPDPISLELWKQHVLQVLRSFGESNPYYTDLLAVDKTHSGNMPRTVFSFFLETLKKARQFPAGGLAWPAPPILPVSANAGLLKEYPGMTPAAAATGKQSRQMVCFPVQATKRSASEEIPEAGIDVPLSGTITQPGREKIKQEPSDKPFTRLDSEAREMYGRLLAAAEDLVTQPDSLCAGKYEEIIGICALTLETLETNPLILSYAAFVATENYLCAHAANVTVLSQAIALNYGLSQEDTILLSFCAMVNDLGMTELRELYSKREYLDDSEFSRITRHVDVGISKLQHITGTDTLLKERIERIIRQVHERVDGSGYPLGLSSTEIDLRAQIIGVADIYEAMTHPRYWREAWHPCAVIKQFRGEDKKFDIKVLRSLIHTLSVYPPASLVLLSSGEIAQVVIPRKGSLTRPLVKVLLGADFIPVRSRVLDLNEPPICHTIQRPVTRDELERKCPEFAARLESERWWKKSAADSSRSCIYART